MTAPVAGSSTSSEPPIAGRHWAPNKRPRHVDSMSILGIGAFIPHPLPAASFRLGPAWRFDSWIRSAAGREIRSNPRSERAVRSYTAHRWWARLHALIIGRNGLRERGRICGERSLRARRRIADTSPLARARASSWQATRRLAQACPRPLVSNWLLVAPARSRSRIPMTQTSAALPDRFRDVEQLEEVMTTPSAALCAALETLPGDIIVLGVGGKIGPTLARLAKRAAPEKRVVGVARFSDKGLREQLSARGIESSQ